MSRFHVIATNDDAIPPAAFEVEAQNIATAIVFALRLAALSTAHNVALVAFKLLDENISGEIISEEEIS